MIFDEFVHPYIDNQIEDPAIKSIVDNLITEEIGSMDPLKLEKKIIPPPVFIVNNLNKATNKRAEYVISNIPRLDPKAELQDLFQQKSHFEILKQRQTEYLSDEIFTAEMYIDAINRENQKLRDDINEIHKKRFLAQTAERSHIQNLKDKEIMLKNEIKETENAIDSLEKEIFEK